ncbi:zinc finger protein 488 [Ctenodactylus gundi]
MAAGKGAPPSPSTENRRQPGEPEQSQGCKPVLLEKTNHLGSETATGRGSHDVACVELAVSTTPSKSRLGKLLPWKSGEQRQSAFRELPRLQEGVGGGWAQDREHEVPSGQADPQHLTPDVPEACVWPGSALGEQRSAFHKPTKHLVETPGPTSAFLAGDSADTLGELSGLLGAGCGQLSPSKLLVGDCWSLQTLSQNALLWRTLQGTPALWLEPALVQGPPASAPSSLALASASWALLPPSLASLGLATQNWCARCSRSFRLTSDLVFHMRSHHKKEPTGPHPLPKVRRQEALTCPVCHEYFRERHHLSRHMTSHS